jgi:hypothetical protein
MINMNHCRLYNPRFNGDATTTGMIGIELNGGANFNGDISIYAPYIHNIKTGIKVTNGPANAVCIFGGAMSGNTGPVAGSRGIDKDGGDTWQVYGLDIENFETAIFEDDIDVPYGHSIFETRVENCTNYVTTATSNNTFSGSSTSTIITDTGTLNDFKTPGIETYNRSKLFAAVTTIKQDSAAPLTVYIPKLATASYVGTDYALWNASSIQYTGGAIRVNASTNTAGAETTNINLYHRIAGVEKSGLGVNQLGQLLCGGPNNRLVFSETGLTNFRTFTFPDVTDMVVALTATQTLTNKTLTSPAINTPTVTGSGGTLTLPAGPDDLVGRATTDTLTNKTLTAPVISTISNTGTLTLPTSTDTLVGKATTDTLTNKLLSTGSVVDKNVFGDIKWATTRKGGHMFGTTTFTDILFTGTSTGGGANVNSTIGRFMTFTTATGDGANAGFKQTSIAYRKFNPYLKWKGRPNTGPTLQATWFGFSSVTTDPAGDTEANSKSYFAVGHRSSDTNFQIIRNDGSASATYVDTAIPVNTTVRTWELIADEVGTRWGWAVDGGAFTYYTTIIPAATTGLTLNLQIELASGGVAKSFDLISMDYESDA